MDEGYLDWVVPGLVVTGFVVGAAGGAWELGIRKGREIEQRGSGKERPTLEELGEVFFSGMGGLIVGLGVAVVVIGIDWAFGALR
jgi:hypothetical protein